jgi:hypothetical protein
MTQETHQRRKPVVIRKLSVGPDYVNASMNYIVGQRVVGGNYEIVEIGYNAENEIVIWVASDNGEILQWKAFNEAMPVAVEFNLDF